MHGTHRPWWLADGSPGALGDPEIWIDEPAMDMYGRGDAAPAVTVTGSPQHSGVPGLPGDRFWAGSCIRFARHGNDLDDAVVYLVISRRWSRENDGHPYYVCVWPD
jgi:hypothetical protein